MMVDVLDVVLGVHSHSGYKSYVFVALALIG